MSGKTNLTKIISISFEMNHNIQSNLYIKATKGNLKCALGPLPTQPLTGITMTMVDYIWYFKQNQSLNIKNMP